MRRPRLVAIAVAQTALLNACIIPFNGPGDVRRDIESLTGSRYDRSLGLTVGRSGIALARWAIRHAEDEEIPIEGIRKVEIGIYTLEDGTGPQVPLSPSDWPGWTPMAEVHQGDGQDASVLVLSMAGEQEGSIRRILLVVDHGDRLAIVRLSGRLEKFIEQAIAFALKETDNPALIEPAIEDYREHLM